MYVTNYSFLAGRIFIQKTRLVRVSRLFAPITLFIVAYETLETRRGGLCKNFEKNHTSLSCDW